MAGSHEDNHLNMLRVANRREVTVLACSTVSSQPSGPVRQACRALAADCQSRVPARNWCRRLYHDTRSANARQFCLGSFASASASSPL